MLPNNAIVPAKLVNITMPNWSTIEVLPKGSKAYKDVIAISSSGQKIKAVKRPQMVMTLVGPKGQHFAIDAYEKIRSYYSYVHFTQDFLDRLRMRFQNSIFQVCDNEIVNFEEILNSL